MSLESDLAAAFLADPWATKELIFGAHVIGENFYPAQTTRGYLIDAERQMAAQDGQIVIARIMTFQYQTSALVGIARDSAVSIEGVNHKVEHVAKVEDGLLSELWLVTG